MMEMIVNQGVKVDLPKALHGLDQDTKFYSIGVKKDGTYFFNKDNR